MIEFDVVDVPLSIVDTFDAGLFDYYFGLIKTGYIGPNGEGKGDGWGFFEDYYVEDISYVEGTGLND